MESSTPQIVLPTKLPSSNEYKRILGEFYDKYKNKQWFHRAELIENHLTHMRPTIEIYCNYNPILEMKEIVPFISKYNLGLEIIAKSHEG